MKQKIDQNEKFNVPRSNWNRKKDITIPNLNRFELIEY